MSTYIHIHPFKQNVLLTNLMTNQNLIEFLVHAWPILYSINKYQSVNTCFKHQTPIDKIILYAMLHKRKYYITSNLSILMVSAAFISACHSHPNTLGQSTCIDNMKIECWYVCLCHPLLLDQTIYHLPR
jgi:hypothetical protein